ncbi:proteasome subunit alpha type-7-1B isoform X2 [Drosophila busckii]|uniref:proteasome subunit alpha type-7-1B isoform X2 n=1 Tax=Drosophila busckii TaxID=30019 RepID=UPI00083EA3D6|nr:proteasome subunit alpha type-7-1B isoform X2 [Drosophila busckii]XP_017836356.1 proteasome subunit alpha type-7-1B isoform X2 [Drosophila busckii]
MDTCCKWSMHRRRCARAPQWQVGLRTKDLIVMGLEKRAVDTLQVERTARKIVKIDDHIIMTFAGLTADARVLIKRAQSEAQSHKLNFERPATVEYMTRFLAKLKQRYTQSNGLRPYGVACLIGGFDDQGEPHLFQTEPSGIFYEWSANTTGRLGATVREYLEKNVASMVASPDEHMAVKHVVRALLTCTSLDASFYEIAVLKHREPMRMVKADLLAFLVKQIKQENAEEEARNKRQALK